MTESPTIICEDYDVDTAAARIFYGKFINAGQTCLAPDYLFVPEAKRDELLDQWRATTDGALIMSIAIGQAGITEAFGKQARHPGRVGGRLEYHGVTCGQCRSNFPCGHQ